MENGFKLSILAPDRKFYEGEVTEIKTDSTNGPIQILARHIPMITSLKPSITSFKDVSGAEHKAFLSTGVLKVKGNEVLILCDAAEWPHEIEEERAKAAKLRAEQRLKENEGINMTRAELALYRALLRLKLK